MINFKKITAILLSSLMLTGFTAGCGDKDAKMTVKDGEYVNFTAPEKGEEVAVITIKDFGDVKVKLFPDLAPKAVENFVDLAKDGYYNDLIFHRVIKDFMIQGGDPKGDGTGGESKWGGSFDGGVTKGLYHFVGAVAYANSGSTATDGSQFYIVTGADIGDDMMNQYVQAYAGIGKPLSDAVQKKYKEIGGAIHLDGYMGEYTVFGQVYYGLDVAEAVSKVEVNAENSKPLEDVVIEKVSIEKYDDEDVKFYLSDYK